jgi:hypothetical protein
MIKYKKNQPDFDFLKMMWEYVQVYTIMESIWKYVELVCAKDVQTNLTLPNI